MVESICTNEMNVDVTQEGAIILGPNVVCDGFYYIPEEEKPETRVQTHIHLDHMEEFDSSKGVQKIIMSPETYDLLVLEKDFDIPIRKNIIPIKINEPFQEGDITILLLSSGHMLGSVQTQVTYSNEKRAGYSGDFLWPLDKVIQVDTLVIDGTCGSIEKKCNYTQEEVKIRLIELVISLIKKKPIFLQAHRGTLQYALDILASDINIPCVCNSSLFREVEIYKKYGYNVTNIYSIDSEMGKEIIKNGRYLYVCDTRKYNPAISLEKMIKVILSRFMAQSSDPILKYSENAYRVAFRAHADFKESLAYIKATGAKEVITDNTRGGHAIELAMEIRAHLGISARPSSNTVSNNWAC